MRAMDDCGGVSFVVLVVKFFGSSWAVISVVVDDDTFFGFSAVDFVVPLDRWSEICFGICCMTSDTIAADFAAVSLTSRKSFAEDDDDFSAKLLSLSPDIDDFTCSLSFRHGVRK
jgi:hypothetical protein